MRRVEDNLEVHVEYLGFYCVDSIGADSLMKVIKDTLLRMNQTIRKRRGLCYDGCSTMSGTDTGVAKTISDEEPHAVFTHCYGHSLSLGAIDTMKQCNE